MFDQITCPRCGEPRHESSLYCWVCFNSFENEKPNISLGRPEVLPVSPQNISKANVSSSQGKPETNDISTQTISESKVSFIFWKVIAIGVALVCAILIAAEFIVGRHSMVAGFISYTAISGLLIIVHELGSSTHSSKRTGKQKQAAEFLFRVLKSLLIAMAVPVLAFILFFLSCSTILMVLKYSN